MDPMGYGQYRSASLNTQVAGASPVQLVLVLMNGLLDEMVRVRAHIEHLRYEEKGRSINKCIDMFAALTSSLDFELGGEAVTQLGRLYDYCTARLNQAGCQLDTGMVEEVIGLVTTLRDAWQKVEDRSA
ncbi:flagellar export chaperone FliS [Dyella jejuensis]|uniref:Flagellar secretion chaperone FliS n=1 Tax=Dyella jejuensis TaxID=1432009 RepID=A0ABW8JI54_9GAMM